MTLSMSFSNPSSSTFLKWEGMVWRRPRGSFYKRRDHFQVSWGHTEAQGNSFTVFFLPFQTQRGADCKITEAKLSLLHSTKNQKSESNHAHNRLWLSCSSRQTSDLVTSTVNGVQNPWNLLNWTGRHTERWNLRHWPWHMLSTLILFLFSPRASRRVC